jgi:hypothetical protein
LSGRNYLKYFNDDYSNENDKLDPALAAKGIKRKYFKVSDIPSNVYIPTWEDLKERRFKNSGFFEAIKTMSFKRNNEITKKTNKSILHDEEEVTFEYGSTIYQFDQGPYPEYPYSFYFFSYSRINITIDQVFVWDFMLPGSYYGEYPNYLAFRHCSCYDTNFAFCGGMPAFSGKPADSVGVWAEHHWNNYHRFPDPEPYISVCEYSQQWIEVANKP